MRIIYILLLLILVSSCNSRERVGKDPYCEFVNGAYTYNLDLRRTISYQGIDFDFIYYNKSMQECVALDAEYVYFKGIGHYYDEKIYAANDIEIHYSSIMLLPDTNRLTNSYLNIFTTLQAERIIYLMRNNLSFEDAKKQSNEEIYEQIKSSDYFNAFVFNKDVDFNFLSMENELLSVLTKSISCYISNIVKLVEDKSIAESIWDEFILNYSLTGDMELINLEPKKGEKNNFIGYLDANRSLKATITKYQMPFSGGVPMVKKNKIFYGVDTNTYIGRIKDINKLAFRVKTPIYTQFECNGYFNINADICLDSLTFADDVRIRVKNMDRYNSDTTYIIQKNSFDKRFSSIIWLGESAVYKVDIIFGRDSISYRVDNKLNSFDSYTAY